MICINSICYVGLLELVWVRQQDSESQYHLSASNYCLSLFFLLGLPGVVWVSLSIVLKCCTASLLATPCSLRLSLRSKRRLVEVPGVEPGSGITVQRTSTHIVTLLVSPNNLWITKYYWTSLIKVSPLLLKLSLWLSYLSGVRSCSDTREHEERVAILLGLSC